MNKQTAVEWLVKELNLEGYDYTVEQAKEMEKQQIIYAYKQGQYDGDTIRDTDAEQYYNETYGDK
jgi:N-acetyl-anhydromuramyl-L-alanine amidase AmpD